MASDPRRLTAAQRLESAAAESEVLEAVIDAAVIGGWLVCHHPDSRRMLGHPGFPDLVLAHPTRGLIFVEAKTRAGRLRAGQLRWRSVLEGAGADVRTVRPGDLPEITAELAGAGRPGVSRQAARNA